MPPLENTTPSTTPVPVAYVPVDTSDIPDENSRLHAVMENVKNEPRGIWFEDGHSDDEDVAASDEDTSSDEDAPPAKEAPVKAAPSPAVPPAPTAEETARKASLANAARLERESVRRSTELAAKANELKAQEAKFADRESKLAAFEKAYDDPDALLSLLAEKVTPEKMSRFFLEQGQPEKVAERRAKAAQEPVTSELTKLREEMAALKKEAADKDAKAAAVVARTAAEKDFSQRVLDNKAEAPLAARFMERRPKDFFEMADSTATRLMAAAEAEGRTASWDDVIRSINKDLSDFRSVVDEDAAAPVAPSTQKTGKNSAAAKAPTTVSNSAASERSVILDEDAKWESLPFDERVKRAEKRERLRG